MGDLEVFVPCDKCRKRSAQLWIGDVGQLLLSFCGHHSREYAAALQAKGFRTLDEKAPA